MAALPPVFRADHRQLWVGLVSSSGKGAVIPVVLANGRGHDRSHSGFSGHSRCPTLKDRFRRPATFTRQDRVTLASLNPSSPL